MTRDRPEQAFTYPEAADLLTGVQLRVHELIEVRANLAELDSALRAGFSSPLGGTAERKGLEARFSETVDWILEQGIQIKGLAPVLIDFPAEVSGQPALWCWLEGEQRLGWYHFADLGFMGRRPVEQLGLP